MNLLQLLINKGLISMEESFMINSSINDKSDDIENIPSSYRTKAFDIVSNMYHKDNGVVYKGEKYSYEETLSIYEEYKNLIDSKYNICDVYIAINAQYHDYCTLYSKWFNDIDKYIIESAIIFWFMDDDYTGNKVKDYFKL